MHIDSNGNGAGQSGGYRVRFNATYVGPGRYAVTAHIPGLFGSKLWKANDGSIQALADGTMKVMYPSNGIVEYWRRAGEPPAKRPSQSLVSRMYHQTDAATAKHILNTQTMLPGIKGLAGAGIYFATDPGLTGHKARKKGVILECTVNIGNFKTLGKEGDKGMTRERLRAEGYDSVRIQRGLDSGQEYVVYESWRVSDIDIYPDLYA